MRLLSALFAALFAVFGFFSPAATQAAELTIVFSGNSWGYLKPCPT